MTFLGEERWGAIGLGSSACKIPSHFPSKSAFERHLPRQTPDTSDWQRRPGSAELAPALEPRFPRQVPNPLPALAPDRPYSLSGYGGGPNRCSVKVPGSIPGKIPKPGSDLGRKMKSMVRYEEVASDPTAVWRIATAANHKTDMVQHQRGDFRKVMAEIREGLNRVEVLVQRFVSSQTRGLPDLVPPAEVEMETTRRSDELRRINLKSTQEIQPRGAPEGNLKPPPTGLSEVDEVFGKHEVRLEEVIDGLDGAVSGEFGIPSWLFRTPDYLAPEQWNHQKPSQGPDLAKQWLQNPRGHLNPSQFQYPARQWNSNSSNDRAPSFFKSLAKGPILDSPEFVGGEPLVGAVVQKKDTEMKSFTPGACKYCGYKWVLGHKCKQNQQVNLMAGDVSDEAQFDLAQLYVGDTGLFWKLPPWPDFCTMNCDSFAQHCGYEVIENFYSVRKVIPIIPGDYSDLELKSVGTVEVNLVQARDLTNKDVIGKSNPFAILYVPPLSDKTKRSKTINKDLNPIGNEYSESIVEDADTHSVTVKIYDDDGIQGSELVGCVQVVLNDLQKGKVKDVWLKLVQDLEIQRDRKNWGQEHLELLNCPFDMKEEAMNNYGKDFGQISSWVKIRSYEQCKVFFSKISPYSEKKNPVPLDVSSLIAFVGNQAPPLEKYNGDLDTLSLAVWSDITPQKPGSYVWGNLTGQIGKLSFRSQGISQDISVGTDEFMSFKKPTRPVLKVRKPRAVVYIIPAAPSALLMNELQWIGLIVKPIDYYLKDGKLHMEVDAGLRNEKLSMDEIKLTPLKIFELTASRKNGNIRGKIDKEILNELIDKGGALTSMMEDRELVQLADPAAIEAMDKKNNICNISVVAHVDHDEAERGTTIKSTAISLFYEMTEESLKSYKKCGRQKLEVLDLDHNTITGVEPSYQRFTCLKSPSLRHVSISALDLSLLMAARPKMESLALDVLEIVTSDSQSTMELISHTLKSLFAKSVGVDKIILDADNLEVLHLNALNLDLFELIGKGTLKHLMIDDVSVTHLDIGESTDHLEIVDVSNFTIVWPKFYSMIFRASSLRLLRFWGENFFNPTTKNWTTKNTGSATYKRGFVQVYYEPIKQIFKTCRNDQKDKLWPMSRKLGVTMKINEKELMGKAFIKSVLQTWLPASNALLEMMILHLHFPSKAQKCCVENLYEEPYDDIHATAIRNYDPGGSLMLNVSKMISVPDEGRFLACGNVFSREVVTGKKDLCVKNVQSTAIWKGKKRESDEIIPCGNTVVRISLYQFVTRTATLTNEKVVDACPDRTMEFPVFPIVRVAVQCKFASDPSKLVESLELLAKPDLMVLCTTEHCGEHSIAGAGELDLDICLKDILKKPFGKTQVVSKESFLISTLAPSSHGFLKSILEGKYAAEERVMSYPAKAEVLKKSLNSEDNVSLSPGSLLLTAKMVFALREEESRALITPGYSLISDLMISL